MMEWLKLLYENIGAKNPIASLILAGAIGAILFAGCWWLLGKQYENDRGKQNVSTPPTVVLTGPASTVGDESPANTGSGNSTTYQAPVKPEEK